MRRTQPAQSLPVQPKDELSPRRMGESRSGFLEAESSNARKGSGKERRKAQTVITNYPTLAAARDEGGDFDCVSGSLVWVGNSRVGRKFPCGSDITVRRFSLLMADYFHMFLSNNP